MDKDEILWRTVEVIAKLRVLATDLPGLCAQSSEAGRTVQLIESELDEIADDVGKVIDNFMAARYVKHNAKKHIHYDSNGLSGHWGTRRRVS